METDSRFRLGILLVHGIGTQRCGETIVRWGDVLAQVIRQATRQTVTVSAVTAKSDSAQGSATAALRLTSGKHSEQWLLSEAWWADSFPAPTYGELVSWSVRAVPWALSLHVANWFWEASQITGWRFALRLVRAALQMLVALAASPFLIVLLAITLVVGLLPISQLRNAILAMQSLLNSTIGDSIAFVESPVRAALIRGRILDRLIELKNVSDQTVIIAHSQGAAAVLDALGGIVDPQSGRPHSSDSTNTENSPTALITHGAGTNKLVSLIALSSGLDTGGSGLTSIARNPASMVVWAMIGLWLTIALLWWEISSQRISPFDLIIFLTFILLHAVPALLLWWMLRHLLMFAGNRFSRAKREHLELIAAVTAWLFVLGASMFSGVWRRLVTTIAFPATPTMPLLAAPLVILVGVAALLSNDLRTAVAGLVRVPPGIRRWLDIYALHDPVPGGKTLLRDAAGPGTNVVRESVAITNRGSFLSDHTSYWENLDGFVLRLVRICAEVSQSPWLGSLPPELSIVDRRAAWRVAYLQCLRWVASLGWLGIAINLWTQYPQRIEIPNSVPNWIPAGATGFTTVALETAVGAFVSCVALRWMWSIWVRSEQAAVLRHQPPTGNVWEWPIGLGTLAWTPIVISIVLWHDDVAAEFFDEVLIGLVAVAAIGFVCALCSTALFRIMIPAPRDAAGTAATMRGAAT